MKKSELKLIIRGIVREEVALSIKAVVNELTQPTQTNTAPRKPLREGVESKKQFTTNSVINEVMNETAQDDEWKALGGSTYDSSKMNDVLQASYGNLMQDSTAPSAENMLTSLGVNPAEAADPIKNMLTKDYSSLLKKVDEKAKQTRGR